MPRSARFEQVVTFASHPLSGNPGFALNDPGGASDDVLAAACLMLRADVIAVVGEDRDGTIPLRFFSDSGPHSGAGHATLAAAHAVLRGGLGAGGAEREAATFALAGGKHQQARIEGGRIAVEFPVMPARRVPRTDDLASALGAGPSESWVAPFGYVAVYEAESDVAGLRPDLSRVAKFDRNAVIATAPGARGSDVVIRVFAPRVGLSEDPVCGTAHRIIVPYWAEKLGKSAIHSRQLSRRGGDLWCRTDQETVVIAGNATPILEGTIRLLDA